MLSTRALIGAAVVAVAFAGCEREGAKPPPAMLTAPRIDALAPVSGATAGGTTVTLTGVGFGIGVTVTFGGTLGTGTTLLGTTRITVITPAHAAGAADVVATNPNGSTDTAPAAFLYYAGVPPAPTIGTVAPTSGATGGGTIVTMTGTGFQTGAAVTFGGIAATAVTVQTAGVLVCTAPAGSTGPATIVVTNPDTLTATATNGFTYGAPAPTLVAITPTSGPAAGGTTVTLTGTGFRGNATSRPTVRIGSALATNVVVLDGSRCTCTTAASTQVGPLNVTLTNPDGQAATLLNGFSYVGAAPTIAGVTPAFGPMAGGTTVTITGLNYFPGVTVTIGGTAATVLSVASTAIRVTSPAGAIGAASVVVTNLDGNSGTAAAAFTFQGPAPAVSAVGPTNGPQAGGNAVTLTGTDFRGGATVTFGGAAATVTGLTATQIVVTAPAGTGTVTVTVTNADGTSGTTSYTYNPAPVLTAIAPTNGAPAGGGTATLTGSAFVSGATVTFGAATAAVGSLTATQITVTIPAGSAGTVTVTVTNPDGQTATIPYTYNPAPTITGIAPAGGPLAGGTSVTLAGTGFLTGATVTFGASNATVTGLTATQLVVTAPAGSAGTATVTVTNPDTQAATTSYAYNPAPTLASVTVTSGPSTGGTAVTLTGTGFLTGATATFGGAPASAVVVVSATQVTCTTPGVFPAIGPMTVTVTNTDGQATSLVNGFTFVGPTPTITGVSPASGSVAGGTSLTIAGTNFATGATVTVGGVSATVTSVTGTQIVVTTGAGTVGPATVVVTNIDGTNASSAGAFTYMGSAPTLSSVNASSGTNAGGTTVTLTGTNFYAGATVLIGGVAAGSPTVLSATQLSCVTPNLSTVAGPQNVTVTNLDGQFVTLAGGFTALGGTPTLTTVSPASGSTGGGTLVTLTGTNYYAGATVTFAGTAATSVTVVSGTSLTCLTPAGSAGSVNVVVTNLDAATVTGTGAYTYLTGPAITTVNPNVGPLAGGTNVTITGTNFAAGVTVAIGGTSVGTVTLTGTTQISFSTPGGPIGPANVTVTNPGPPPAPSTLVNGFTYQGGVPALTAIAPTNGAPAGGNPVTLTGSNLYAGATVTFGGTAATGVVVTPLTQITCTVPAGSVGTVTVTVTNVDGQAATTSYTYNPAPTIAAIALASGPLAGGNTVTLTGTGYLAGVTVTFGGSNAPVTSFAATALEVTVPSGSAGTVTVTVTNPDGQVATTTYTYNPAPTVAGIAPGNGRLAGGNAVTLTGSGFLTGATVTFGGSGATVTSLAPGQIVVTAPAGSGTVTVTVTNPDTQTATTAYTYNPLPTLSAIAPSNGAPAGGNAVTLTGTGFLTGVAVTFGSNAATVTSFAATQLVVTAPAGAVGTVTVTVTNPDTQAATTSYTYNPAPTLSAIAPTNGAPAGGNAVTLTGTGFLTGVTVTFGASAATVTGSTATQVVVTAPAGAVGTVTVTATNPDGQAATTSYAYNAAPTVTGIALAGGPLAGGNNVTITGTGFLTGVTVTFAAANAPVTGFSATQLVVTAPAGSAGSATVTVTNLDGQAATTSYAYNPAPTISAIALAGGPLAGGATVTLTGTGFLAGATVRFGANAATGVTVSPTQITCTTPSSGAGTVIVTVTNTDAQAATTSYSYNPAPTCSGIAPTNGAPAGGNSVTLTGTGFLTGVTVAFGGNGATLTSFTATQLVVTAPAGSVGTATVTIANPDAQTVTTSYTYNAAPTVTSIAPTAGPLAGGTSATITGTGFLTGVTVTFGSNAAAVTAFAAGSLIVTIPAGTSGAATVTVTNLDGQAATTTYTYNPAPTISSIALTGGPLAGGNSVTLTGTGYLAGVTVTFGSNAAAVTSLVATQIVVTAPAGSAGSVTVTVTNSDGQSATTTYSYNPAPTIGSIAPTNGAPAGGNPVTITGSGYLAGGTVTFGVATASVTSFSATVLVVTAPAGSVGTVTVTVTNPDTQAATTSYTYNAAPTLSAIAPTNGPASGGNSVTLTGTGFLTGVAVTFGATGASVTSFSATQLVVTAPAGSPGGVTVTVTNTDGQAATIGYAYNPPPAITAIAPTSGLTTGGYPVTISGSAFIATPTVTFGSNAATVTSFAAGQLVVTAPASATNGAVTVTVTNPDGQAATTTFTYVYPAPGLTAISPTSGPEIGGALVTCTGSAFLTGATVAVGGAAATSVVVVGPTSITARTPAGTPGPAVSVVVTNPDAQSVTLVAAYTYRPVQTQVVTGQGDFGQQHQDGTTAFASPGDIVLTRIPAAFDGDTHVATAIAYDHSTATPTRILVGTAHAGVFLTTNGGSTWTTFNLASAPPLPSNRVTCVAWFSGNTAGQTWIVGTDRGAVLTRDGGLTFRRYDTGSFPALPANGVEAISFFDGNTLGDRFLLACNNGTKLAPGGAVLTTDGGTTFRTFNSVSTPSITNNYVRGVAFFSGDTTGQRFLLANYSINSPGDGGVWRTSNGGTSFTRFSTVSVPNTPSQAARAVAYCHADTTGATWLAAFDTLAGGNGGVILTTNDGATAFTLFNVAGGELPSDIPTRLAWSGTTSRFVIGTDANGIAYTTNGGTSFTFRGTGSSPALLGDVIGGVDWFRGNTQAFAVASGVHSATAVNGGAQVTADAGASFATLGVPAGLPHPDVRSVAIFRGDGTGNRILVATGAGAALTTDRGQTWTWFTAPTLPSSDVRAVAFYEGVTTGLHFLVGTAGGAARTANGGTTFATYTTPALPSNDVRAVAYFSGNTTLNGGTFLIGTAGGAALTTSGGAPFTTFTTVSSPSIPSNTVQAVAFYDGNTTGSSFLIGTASGACRTTDGGATLPTLSGLPSTNVSSAAYFHPAASATTFLVGTAAGAALTANNGSAWTTYNTTNGLPTADVDGVAFCSGATTATIFAIACRSGAQGGGCAITTNGGTSFSVRNPFSAPPLPAFDAIAVDFDDSVASGGRLVIGVPAPPATGIAGGVVVEDGVTYPARGAVTLPLVDGGVIPVAAPLAPTWDDRFLRGVDYWDGDTTGTRAVIGGIYGAAATANGGTTFQAVTETSTPALLFGVVFGVRYHGGDTTGQTYGVATPFGAYVTTNGGTSFTRYGSGNGLPTDDCRAIAFFDGTTTASHFCVATGFGIAYTTNGGTTFTIRNSTTSPNIANDCRDVDYHDGTASGARFAVATGSGVYHTSNGGGAFTQRTAGGATTIPSNDVRSLRYSEVDTTGATWLVGAWFTGPAPGGAGLTTNDGGAFTRFLPNTVVHGVDYHKGIAGSWAVAHSTGLAVTTNNGGGFTTYTTTQGLPSNDVRSVAYAGGTSTANTWLVGTDEGVVRTTNGGTSFTTFRKGTLSSNLHAAVTTTLPAGTAIRWQVCDASWVLLPDAVLPGNSAGLLPDGSGNVDLTAIPVGTYPVLQLRAVLTTSVPASTPSLHEVRIRFQY